MSISLAPRLAISLVARKRLIPVGPSVAYDLILVAADSYGVGVQERAGGDTLNSNVYQYNSDPSGLRYRTITRDLPLYNPNGSETGNTGITSPLSIAESFANAHATRTGNPTIIIPFSWNGTSLTLSGHGWQVGDTLHEGAITQANLAIAAAKAVYSGSKLAAIALLDSGLANDAKDASPPSKATVATALSAAVADFRSRITGAASVPVIFHGFPPQFVASTGAGARNAEDAIREYCVANANTYFVYADATTGTTDDNLHFNNAAVRIYGPKLDAITVDTTAPDLSGTPGTYAGVDGQPIHIPLDSAGEYVTWTTATSGWEIVRTFGTGGTGGINTTIASYRVQLTSDGNASYSSQPANPTVTARDGAGNTTNKTIAVSVAAPYGVGDQGAVTVTHTATVVTTGLHNTPFTVDVPLAAGLNCLTFNSDAGSGDVVGVADGGNAATAFSSGGASVNCFGTCFGLIEGAAATKTLTITPGLGNSYVGDLVIQVISLTGSKAAPTGTPVISPAFGFHASPCAGASETFIANGVILGMGCMPSPAAAAGSGNTLLHAGNGMFAAKRSSTGSVSVSGGDGYSAMVSMVFEKSV